MTSRPKVVVTRSAAEGAPLAAALLTHGFDTVFLPVLGFDEGRDLDRLEAALSHPDLAFVALTSRRAIPALVAHGAVTVPVVSVGSSTTEALGAAGVSVALTGDGDGASGLVRAIARWLASSPLTRRRVLWPTGDRSRPELRDGLAALGFVVEEVEVYRTRAETLPSSEVRAAIAEARVVCFASPSQVSAFDQGLGAADLELLRETVAAAVLGETTAHAARAAGWRRITVAETPNVLALAAAAARAHSELHDV